MSFPKTLCGTGVLALGVLCAWTPAQAAITTFASYSATSEVDNMRWYGGTSTIGGHLHTVTSPGSQSTGAADVIFNFLPSSLASLHNLSAEYTFDGTTAAGPAQSFGGFLVQPITQGSFSFIYSGVSPITIGNKVFTTGANLLSGTFTDASVLGQIGSTSGSMNASEVAGGSIVYSSDFIKFDNTLQKDFSINFSAVTPGFGQANSSSAINTFDANSGGAFSADTAALGSTVPDAPTWAMLTLGFGLIGASTRRRYVSKSSVSVTA